MSPSPSSSLFPCFPLQSLCLHWTLPNTGESGIIVPLCAVRRCIPFSMVAVADCSTQKGGMGLCSYRDLPEKRRRHLCGVGVDPEKPLTGYVKFMGKGLGTVL